MDGKASKSGREFFRFHLSESCPSCTLRRCGFFCRFSEPDLKAFDAVKFVSGYPSGTMLFAEGQKCRGIFVLCQGEVKLTCGSDDGRSTGLRIAGPGEVLGLDSALSDRNYEATAETLGPCQVAFVRQRDFERFLEQHPAVLSRVAEHLGLQYREACRQVRVLGLGSSSMERVARFLLGWSWGRGAREDGQSFILALSQEQISEFVGTTRESVTRTLAELRERGLIVRRGAQIVIPDRKALQEARTRRQIERRSELRPLRVVPVRPTMRSLPRAGENGRKIRVMRREDNRGRLGA